MYTIHDNLIASDGKTADKGITLLSVFNYTMKKEITKKVEKKATKKGEYTLEVSVNDVKYKGSGATMAEALAGFVSSKDFPFSVKTAVVFNFSDGKKKGTQILRALMGRRMFNAIAHKPSAIEIQARKMEERLA